MAFIGRQKEIELLRQGNWRSGAELIVIYGRRRVGKTALIEAAFGNAVLWKFEGLENEPVPGQIRNFMAQLALYSGNPRVEDMRPRDWRGAFAILARELRHKNVVVFLDEFQWLANMKPGFVSLFKFFWDNHFLKLGKIKFILCGSVSSFMVKKVLKSRALYGRVDTEINLLPLSIPDIRRFLEGSQLSPRLLETSMIVGGVPAYLRQLHPGLSLEQNLNEQWFSQHGYFLQEYQKIFISHFALNHLYEKIIVALVGGAKSAEQLAKACKTATGGSFTNLLFDLTTAGFIDKFTPLDKPPDSRLAHYRLADEYLHFHFSFVHPHVRQILSGEFKYLTIVNTNAFARWQGYAFERLCLKHSRLIADHLRFSGVNYKCGKWFNQAIRDKPGAQVDLLFERADRVLTVCEMKFTAQIKSKELMKNLDAKMEVLKTAYPGYGVQKVLVLGKAMNIPQAVKNYFDGIVEAEKLYSSFGD